MDGERALLALARRQHALVTRKQARGLGLGADAIRHRVRRGQWELVTDRVLRRTGAASTDEQHLMLAVLHHGPDAYVARSSALGLWGLPGFATAPVELVRARAHRGPASALARLHTGVALPGTHLCEQRGIPVTSPIRAIFDIAGEAHPKRVERALDNAWSRRLLTHATLHRTLAELAARGRPGIQLMRALAAERPPDFRPAESATEARLNDLLAADGQVPLLPQVDVGGDGGWVGRVDLRDPLLPHLVVEVQSALFHGSLADRRADDERRRHLQAAGFELVEVWEDDVWRHPERATRLVAEARRRAAGRPSPTHPPDDVPGAGVRPGDRDPATGRCGRRTWRGSEAWRS